MFRRSNRRKLSKGGNVSEKCYYIWLRLESGMYFYVGGR